MVHLHIKGADPCEKVITLIVPLMECQVTQSFDCEDHGLLWTTDYGDRSTILFVGGYTQARTQITEDE